jgi:homocysteine S-methyltransferase
MNIKEFLESGKIVVLDGGFGTLIEQRSGEKIGLKSYVWGAAFLKQDPALVKQIHYDYLKAGADIVITSTFKAHATGFAEIGVQEPEAFDLCVMSTKLAQ